MNHTACYRKGYPRPQFVRTAWEDLNGEWRFGFGEEVTQEDALKGKLPRTICVPFSYETPMSGIGTEEIHHRVWYSRTIGCRTGKRALLRLEGADYKASVYVNGAYAGSHCGSYAR